MSKWNGKLSKKDTGFEQTLAIHQHWHIDFSHIMPAEQRGWLQHAEGHTCRASAGDPRRGKEVGGGAKRARVSPTAGLREILWPLYEKPTYRPVAEQISRRFSLI
jgi:hypothetical protein